MRCTSVGGNVTCARWFVLAGMLASAIAALVLLTSMSDSDASIREGADEVYGM